ncbi:MAG: VanW family protein [Akkermansiaceae bacterium]|nr:VanW family protein [Akkermansiaceae bacterium]
MLRWRRRLIDWDAPVRRYPVGNAGESREVISEQSAKLWTNLSAAEFPLTAGKVENLRVAARRLHRVEIPAGEIWSFWKQLGRPTRANGFVAGRELREGCLVPAIGGGLCQLSGLIYQAALDAGLEVIERHGHTRVIAGSLAEEDKDATIFWNYVDLRLHHARAWRMEVELTTSELIVRILSDQRGDVLEAKAVDAAKRPPITGDCLTCGMVECFRHPSALSDHAPAQGHSAYLLDGRWPEFEQWCAEHSREGDCWLTPLDGCRWRKPNYQWRRPSGISTRHATLVTLWRSFQHRRLPAQGALRQRSLLDGSAALANHYARKLDPTCRHVVVSQSLLPFLWRSGALGGRSFDVLIERWPLHELQQCLDRALERHPDSPTLGDFRADPDLARAEQEALAAAGRMVTPHRAMAEHFGAKAWLVDWKMPKPIERQPSAKPTVFLPCSRLGRKGAYELAAALRKLDGVELKHLGRAEEGVANLFEGVECSPASLQDLAQAHALVLPAWVEHQPRHALKALASGIPVVASTACGLPDHPNLHRMHEPSAAALEQILRSILDTSP